jgi:hypothetical protein
VYATARLEGVVFAPDSLPAADRRVDAVDCDGHGSVFNTTTREDGTFSLSLAYLDWEWGAPGSLPADTGGYFTLHGCQVNISTRSTFTVQRESVAIRFARRDRAPPVTWLELWETQ